MTISVLSEIIRWPVAAAGTTAIVGNANPKAAAVSSVAASAFVILAGSIGSVLTESIQKLDATTR